MSRVSVDQYQIPLRSLGRGRRKPARSYSNVSNPYVELDVEDRIFTDEAPLIHKDNVLLPNTTGLLMHFSILTILMKRDQHDDSLGFLVDVNNTFRGT